MEMRSMALSPAMRAHLDSLAAMPVEVVAAMLPAHRMVVSEMLDAMSADMGMMGITADSEWVTLVDSLWRDLAEWPQLGEEALRSRLREHLRRMRALMDMHEAMMVRRMKCQEVLKRCQDQATLPMDVTGPADRGCDRCDHGWRLVLVCACDGAVTTVSAPVQRTARIGRGKKRRFPRGAS